MLSALNLLCLLLHFQSDDLFPCGFSIEGLVCPLLRAYSEFSLYSMKNPLMNLNIIDLGVTFGEDRYTNSRNSEDDDVVVKH